MSSGEPATKKAKVALEELPEHLSGMAEEVKKHLVDIDGVQSEIDTLNEQASDEILKIEAKYNLLRQPHYENRSTLIKNIPKFWFTALINHPQLSSIIEEKEVPLLQSLINIEVEEYDDLKKGYKIRFTFGPNEFFENDKIEKEFLHGDDPSCNTSTIKWKEGKSLARSENNSIEPLSFVEWLAENVDPSSDDVAELLKDDLWPNPVQYFLCPDIEELGDNYEELLDDEENLDEVDDEVGSEGEN